MTEQHPIMPPDELVQQWRNSKILLKDALMVAAQWGADQELEACVGWLDRNGYFDSAHDLGAARRPGPQTLNSIALEMLGTIEKMDVVVPEITDTIRRALEALLE
jgi:hypothetical protein